MNIKLIALTLMGLTSVSSFAEYQIKMNIPDLKASSFVVPGGGEPTDPIDPEVPEDVCPTNLVAPTFAAGFPRVRQNMQLFYEVEITSAGGYNTVAEASSTRFFKMVSTTVSGIPFGNGGLYAGTVQTWGVNPGETINVIMTPSVIDLQSGTICYTGTPVQLVNKTYAQLLSEVAP